MHIISNESQIRETRVIKQTTDNHFLTLRDQRLAYVVQNVCIVNELIGHRAGNKGFLFLH